MEFPAPLLRNIQKWGQLFFREFAFPCGEFGVGEGGGDVVG